jgi:hypothetical protein
MKKNDKQKEDSTQKNAQGIILKIWIGFGLKKGKI